MPAILSNQELARTRHGSSPADERVLENSSFMDTRLPGELVFLSLLLLGGSPLDDRSAAIACHLVTHQNKEVEERKTPHSLTLNERTSKIETFMSDSGFNRSLIWRLVCEGGSRDDSTAGCHGSYFIGSQ